MLGAHRSYALRITAEDARQIALRGATVVVPVIAMFVLHSGDIYLLAPWVSASQLGVYRLASRLGSPPSYFASAFIMTWGPLERSSLVAAAFKVRGQHHVRGLVMTYYMLVGLSIVVLFVAFSRLLVLIAPASYAEAAKVVPLIAFAYVMFGAYIILLRTTRPDRMMLWYGISSCSAVAVYFAASFILIPALGLYGAPLANIAGLTLAGAIVLWRNARNEDPVPVDFRRMSLGFLVAGSVSASLLLGMQAGHVVSAVVTLVALAAYVPALVLVGAIPGSHLPLLKRMVPLGRSPDLLQVPPNELPAAERDALTRHRAGTLHGSDSNVEYARLTRALRRIGGIGNPSRDDARIGVYLASRDPEAIRDYQMRALIDDGVDAFELYRLDRLAKAARKSRFGDAPRRPRSRRRPRAARTLDDRTRAQLAELLTPIDVAREQPGTGGHAPALGLVRALRLLRRSFGVGAPTATDLTLARAIWHEDDGDLSSWQRTELRALKKVARVASRSIRGGTG
jgi:hypothetical protein